MDTKELVAFLQGLEANNHKEWFDQNRSRYNLLKKDFLVLVQQIIFAIRAFDATMQGLDPKDCIFRINRDIRFSKDKSPYKTMFSGAFSNGGKNSSQPLYYFHIDAQGCLLIAAGLYMPEAKQLEHIREVIDQHPQRLKKILHERTFEQTFGQLDGEKLKTAPKGYKVDHPEIDLLRLKSFAASFTVGPSILHAVNLPEYIPEQFQIGYPLVAYMREVVT